ncbi:MAG: GNAT family N-acetyltransferase [Alistipes sp.]
MELIFRQTTAADMDRIMEIIGQAQAQMRALGSKQWQNGYPALANIASDAEHGYGYVLCDRHRIIAYAAVVFDGEAAYASIDGAWLSDRPYVVVHRLAVANERKQQGIAAQFLCHVEGLCAARGVGSFRIDTNFDNHYMLHLLEHQGFAYCGEIRYSDDFRQAFEKLLP